MLTVESTRRNVSDTRHFYYLRKPYLTANIRIKLHVHGSNLAIMYFFVPHKKQDFWSIPFLLSPRFAFAIHYYPGALLQHPTVCGVTYHNSYLSSQPKVNHSTSDTDQE